jgi:hypothetical protein
VANTLAYYDTATITAVKSFIVQAPVACIIELITETVYYGRNKFYDTGPGLIFQALK